MANTPPLSPEEIAFQNAVAQHAAEMATLDADIAVAVERERKFRPQGVTTNQQQQTLYTEAQKTLQDLQEKRRTLAGKKPGAAGARPSVATTSREQLRSGVGYDAYAPTPGAVNAAGYQQAYGMDVSTTDKILAALKAFNPIPGMGGGGDEFFNALMAGNKYYDADTLRNILDPAGFNAGLIDDAARAAMGNTGLTSGTADTDVALTTGEQTRTPIATQQTNEAAGTRDYNTRWNRANMANNALMVGRRGAQVGLAGLSSVAASSAMPGLLQDPSKDPLGYLSRSAFGPGFLSDVLGTDQYNEYRDQMDAREKVDARLFKGIYGYDRKMAGGRNDFDGPVSEAVQANRVQLRKAIMDTILKKGVGPQDTRAYAAQEKDLNDGFRELDGLIQAAAVASRTGKIPKALSQRIKANSAWLRATGANPKAMIYGTDANEPNAGERGNIYALGMDEDGGGLVFGRQSKSRDSLFEIGEFEDQPPKPAKGQSTNTPAPGQIK